MLFSFGDFREKNAGGEIIPALNNLVSKAMLEKTLVVLHCEGNFHMFANETSEERRRKSFILTFGRNAFLTKQLTNNFVKEERRGL